MSPTNKTPDELDAGGPDSESVDRARRRLLTMAVYIPPTILGIIALQQAGCQVATCGPNSGCNPGQGCNPGPGCAPDTNPCAPNTGCPPTA